MTRDLDLGHYRELLDKERQRMVRQMRIADETESQSESVSELSDYDEHPADVATETFQREKDRALRDNARTTIERIDKAVQKMERGTYGQCDICGAEIPAGRLEAVPYATLCVKCHARVEG